MTEFNAELDAMLDADTDHEQEIADIGHMIERATKYGLLIEVVSAYGEARASGASVSEAAFSALYEWDI